MVEEHKSDKSAHQDTSKKSVLASSSSTATLQTSSIAASKDSINNDQVVKEDPSTHSPLTAANAKRPTRNKKKSVPITKRVDPNSPSATDENHGSAQGEISTNDQPDTDQTPTKKRNKKKGEKECKDTTHIGDAKTLTGNDDPTQDKQKKQTRKKKKKADELKKTAAREQQIPKEATVDTPAMDDKKPKTKKPRNRKKKDDKTSNTNSTEPLENETNAGGDKVNVEDTQSKKQSVTIKEPLENGNDGIETQITNQLSNKTAPTMPSFSLQHRRRLVDLPLEEMQFNDLPQLPKETTSQQPVHITPLKPLWERKKTPEETKTKQPAHDNASMPRRDRKKKLTTGPVLDPAFTLSNYFVPANKQPEGSTHLDGKKDPAISLTNHFVPASKQPEDLPQTSQHNDYDKNQQQKRSSKNQKDHQQNDNQQISVQQKDHKQRNKQQKDDQQSNDQQKGHQLKDHKQNSRQQNNDQQKDRQLNDQPQTQQDEGESTKANTRKAKKERRRKRIEQELEKKMEAIKQSDYIHRDDKVTSGRRPRYEPYMSPKMMVEQIENNTLYQGVIRINKRNRSDSYVTSDDLEYDIYINGLRDRNRALEGDMVAVRLLDTDAIWNRKKHHDAQKHTDLQNGGKDALKNGATEIETDDEDNVDKNKPKLCGQVVGILHRMEGQQITGTLHIDRHTGSPTSDSKDKEGEDESDEESPLPVANNNHVRLVWLRPTDKRAPFIAIPVSYAPDDFLKDPSKYKNEIFAAKYSRWPIDSQFPFGKLVADIGPLGEMAVEAQSILANNNILDADFSAKALHALPKTPWTIPGKEYKTRRDLRTQRIFTIDPETAKDLDDALHITRLNDGQYEVGVHIADVSFFLKRNTQLDVEARDRATSTYLVDRVIPMLPSLLCEQLCSLNPDVERLAFSVIWKMDAEGNILDTWFGRTIIKSCAKLAYDDAQSVIDSNGLPSTAKVVNHPVTLVEQDILDLHKLSLCMRKRRYENGALSMNSIKLSFKLDQDGEPEKVWVYQLKESNRLIEEFMLRANMSVAEKICEQYPGEAMLRRHEPPIERRLDEFIQVAENLGYYIDGSTSGTLQASFDAIESEDVKYVLRILAIKPMRRAKYFCTGSFDDTSKFLHFALNVPMYTHFTSPIRRYADVIVHRQLESILQGNDECGYAKKNVQSIALQCNRKKDGAKNAQEQSGHLYLTRYLARISHTEGPIIRQAIVLQVNSDTFDFLVPDYGLESRAYMDAMPLDRFAYDAGALTVYWKDNKGATMDTVAKIRENNKTGLADDKTSIGGHNRVQIFKTFANFDVLIQVSVDRTPPIINIYPVNPFFSPSA